MNGLAEKAVYSGGAAAGVAFLTLALAGDAQLAAAAFALAFLLSLAAIVFWEESIEWRRGLEMEAGVAFCLKQVAVCLDSGISFERALEGVSGDAFSRELHSVLRESQSAGLGKALASAASRSSSMLCKRAFLQLARCYATGSSQGLRRLSAEATALQLARLREFSSKQAFYGIVFVTASAIVPASFAAIATVGSAFLSFAVDPRLALLAFAVGFPLADGLVLALLYLQSPVGLVE